ncbi:DnaJ-domain-containing protein [Hypoxylon rubiginosum]|uniref:DnaJ-domain-containing protein n=1 Tax=Hypoxylon rubiginosum TaxID=110542 RepID=A0ACC0CY02_9PEZI|nr:DnaJ-domain-containing protein [Hypoxylon rubiginosum]
MSSLPPDPYKTLGVSKDAQLPEIRQAHRKLVLRCHPDKVQDPKQKEEKQKEFQQVQQAYELLSNEVERARYDDKCKLEELRRERGTTSTSSPRTSKRSDSKYYDVREAEPRPSTFASSPGSHNVYGHTPPSRSWDEDIHAYKREYEKPRHARKTQSYEYEKPKPSRKDEERLKRKEEEEWAREKERSKAREKEIREAERQRDIQRERDVRALEKEREKDRDREKELAKKDKDRRKDDRKEDKKKSEKERRKESDEKHRRRNKSPYLEELDEVIYATSSSKPEKTSSSSRKYEEPISTPPLEASHPTEVAGSDRERKYSANLEHAFRYLSRSGGNPPAISRAQTYHPDQGAFRHINPIAVPTPPPAANAMFAPPPVSDPREAPLEDDAKRSSGRARRMSHDTPRSSKDKSSHKKSNSRDPLIVEASSPTARVIPGFHKSSTMPSPMHRSTTVDDYSHSRPPVAPGLGRAQTWMADPGRVRERSHSRHNRGYIDESSEDDRRQQRRSRRTHSPEPMPIPMRTSTKRYTVKENTSRAIPVEPSYFDDAPRSSRKGYPSANSSARRADPYYDEYEEEPRAFFHNVKYASTFDPSDVKFAEVAHTPLREEVYT